MTPSNDLEQIPNIDPFSGCWQGNGTDSAGNEFAFAAKVSHLGDNKYRVLILDKLDTLRNPIHIMDGVLENNQFPHTADEGLFEGGGTLSEDTFEGYYKGPIGGTYRMWRIKQEACDTAPDKEYSDCKDERELDQ
jgi:hypothetical protein